MIVITSKKDGFRRCGVSHPGRPTEYEDARFSEEQLALLQAEPMLTVVVQETDGQKAKADDSKAQETKAAAAKAKTGTK